MKQHSAPFKPSSSRTLLRPAITPGWKSGNWSGYALERKKRGAYHSISGYWLVPPVKCSKKNGYSSAWIGIDGFNNSSLIQTGTEQEYVNGKKIYYAWWEILPAPETKIPYPVSPHDLMYARISRLSHKKWLILLANRTKGWVFKTVKTYTGPARTAEWIMEAPTINGQTSRLANYGKILFKCCRVNRRNPLLSKNNRGIMVQNKRIVSTPSLPNKQRNGFTVAYGSKIPCPRMKYHPTRP
jgi:hypothetical protein